MPSEDTYHTIAAIVFFEREEWRAFRSALDDEKRWQRYVAENRVMGPTKIAAHIDTERRYGAGRKPESDATAECRRRLLECGAIFDALLWTGCRLGEILDLRWESVDLRNGFLHVGQIKTSNVKSIPIGAEFRAELEAWTRGVGKAHVYTRSAGTAVLRA